MEKILTPVLILGANGKLARALRCFWQAYPSAVIDPTWAARGQELADVGPFAAVVALWGVTQGTEAELAQNAELAQRAVEIARTVGAERVLHLSSAAVYTPSDAPLSESGLTAPDRPYGQAKCAMEAQIATLPKPPLNCRLRLANVAGSDSLFKALSGDEAMVIDRFEGGNGPLRSYIAVPELARVIEALVGCAAQDLPEVVNVAAADPVDMAQIATAAGRRFEPCAPRKGAVERYVLDTTRLRALVELPAHASDPAHLVMSWRNYGGWA